MNCFEFDLSERVMRHFNIIVACSENRVIGVAGKLPWSIPEDSHFFKNKTAGQSVIMGRVCFDSWRDACTLKRNVFVLTHSPLPKDSPALAVTSLDEALEKAAQLKAEIFVCGGELIYEQAIIHPYADTLYLTLIHKVYEGDRIFPDWEHLFTTRVEQKTSNQDGLNYTFFTLKKALPVSH